MEYTILVGNPERRRTLVDLNADGRVIHNQPLLLLGVLGPKPCK
jgi:hypothetical protein